MDNREEYAFLAVLIYDSGNGWRSEEPRVYVASHPEIAYRRALADGAEQRYGRTFIGLSLLEETNEDVPPIAHMRKGDPHELVAPVSELTALKDPRFHGIPWDRAELEDALRDPPLLFEVEGLDAIGWHQVTHAYGAAVDVPKDIRRLAALEREVRESARWQLGGSIYHQGTIYPATAVAVPFLIRMAVDLRLPDRDSVCNLLVEIASSTCTHPDLVRKNWKDRRNLYRDHFEKIYERPWIELANEEIAVKSAVAKAFSNEIELIRRLAADPIANIAKLGQKTLEFLEKPQRVHPACIQCGGSGACYCQRVGMPKDTCRRCEGTGRCHVCKGSGDLIVDLE